MMSGSAPTIGSLQTTDAAELVSLALSQPALALTTALAVLSGSPTALDAASAHQAAGIVYRDAGQSTAAIEHLQAARRLALRVGAADRVLDIDSSLGVALVKAGKTRAGLRRMNRCVEDTTGLHRVRALVRRSVVHLILGRPRLARDDLTRALRVARDEGADLWEARCLLNRSWANMELGQVRRATRDALAAERLFVRLGQHTEATRCRQNLGWAAYLSNDIPRALDLLQRVAEDYVALGHSDGEVLVDRAQVLLDAGLLPEAVDLLEAASRRADLDQTVRAELLVVASTALSLQHDPQSAEAEALRARALLRHQGRRRWMLRADLAVLRARAAQRVPAAQLVAPARRLTVELDQHDSPDAIPARLLYAQVLHDLGRQDEARASWQVLTERCRTGPPQTRAAGWLAQCHLSRGDGDVPRVLSSARRGLSVLDEYTLVHGDFELRALATEHGRALADAALSAALLRTPRMLLDTVEVTRAISLRATVTQPVHDDALEEALAAARSAQGRHSEGAEDRGSRERRQAEARVRQHFRRLRLGGSGSPFRVGDVVAAVGPDALICLCDVRGVLYAVLVHRGRVTRREVGPSENATRESEFARFALRRAAYGRVPDIAALGARLQQALLGAVADGLPERVTVVPPATLHTAPWGLLPGLADRVVGVAPSARLWLRARARERTGQVVFVGGPQLTHAQAEVTANRTRYAAGSARVHTLTGARATASAVTRALAGAGLAHVAAHGDFRADAPLFSSLRLHDGPLYLYDLQRLARPPHTVVLSACDVGDTRAVGVDEGLGLVTGLLGLGTSSVLASTVPVNDQAAVLVTGHLHDALAAGADLPTAWLAARRHTRADPLAAATAAAFTAWGA